MSYLTDIPPPETYQIRVFDADGRVRLAYPPVPVEADVDGWVSGMHGALAAATYAAATGAAKVVVRTVTDEDVVFIETGKVLYPPSLVEIVERAAGGLDEVWRVLAADLDVRFQTREGRADRQLSTESRGDYLGRIFAGGDYGLVEGDGVATDIDPVDFIQSWEIETPCARDLASMRRGEALQLSAPGRHFVIVCHEPPTARRLGRNHSSPTLQKGRTL